MNCVLFAVIACACKILNLHVHNTPQKHRQSTKLRFITFSMRTKVLIQFGSCETMFVELIMRANTKLMCIHA